VRRAKIFPDFRPEDRSDQDPGADHPHHLREPVREKKNSPKNPSSSREPMRIRYCETGSIHPLEDERASWSGAPVLDFRAAT
jgi:hypothetical protein